MRIAISSTGPELESAVDSRFGRCAGFLIYDLDNDTHEFVDNGQNREAASGAGVQAGRTVVAQNVSAVLTWHCGPKASQVLEQGGVTIHNGYDGTIQDAVAKFRSQS